MFYWLTETESIALLSKLLNNYDILLTIFLFYSLICSKVHMDGDEETMTRGNECKAQLNSENLQRYARSHSLTRFVFRLGFIGCESFGITMSSSPHDKARYCNIICINPLHVATVLTYIIQIAGRGTWVHLGQFAPIFSGEWVRSRILLDREELYPTETLG